MKQYHILALNWRCMRHPQAGGSEVNIFEQAQHWVRAGQQVTVVCADPGRAVAPQQNNLEDGINVRRMGGTFSVYLWVAWFLLRYGRQFDRIVDVSNGIPFFSPLFTRTPSVLMVHHVHDRQWFSEFPLPFAAVGWLMERFIVPLVYRRHRVIAVSPTTAEALIATGFKESQLFIIYSGVAAPLPAHALPDSSVQRVTYVGRLKRYKRVERLVRSVAALRQQFPHVQLDIVGDGDTRPDLEALIAELGLQSTVTLHGFVDDQTKADLLGAATVFAMPSMHEGWGLSVIEANTYGCPAVAYNVPGLRAAIRAGETGLLAEDDAGFQAALAALLGDPPLRARLGAAAQRWSQRFSWAATATATLDLLESLGDEQPRAVAYGDVQLDLEAAE